MQGFCWSDINTTFLKCRQKQKSINDVKSMSLYALTENVPEYYIVCIINSIFMSYYVDDFVNNTQTFQINDARQLPIIIPSKEELERCKPLYERAVALSKNSNQWKDNQNCYFTFGERRIGTFACYCRCQNTMGIKNS